MAVVLAHRLVVAHQLVGAQQQLGEVDHALALALVLVGLVDLHQLLRLAVVDLDVLRPQPVLLGAGDEPGHLLGDEALLVELHRLDDALDGRQRVGRVEDLEALRQPGQLPVRAQEAVAQAVEGADPHAAHVDGQHRRQPRLHLLGRLVGERDGHQPAGRHLPRLQQPGDARGEHARLARAGAGQDQRGTGGQRHRRQLLGVQAAQQPVGRRGFQDRRQNAGYASTHSRVRGTRAAGFFPGPRPRSRCWPSTWRAGRRPRPRRAWRPTARRAPRLLVEHFMGADCMDCWKATPPAPGADAVGEPASGRSTGSRRPPTTRPWRPARCPRPPTASRAWAPICPRSSATPPAAFDASTALRRPPARSAASTCTPACRTTATWACSCMPRASGPQAAPAGSRWSS